MNDEMKPQTIRDFQDLMVWQKAMSVVVRIYGLTARLPECEAFGLRMQMRAASVSVPSNIAEGFRRSSRGDFRRHLCIAFGSLGELQTQLMVCRRLGLRPEELPALLAQTDEVSRMLGSLIRKLGKRSA
jgi:four helix bundle protein